MPTDLLIQVAGETVDLETLDALVDLSVEEATREADALTVTARLDPSPDGEWVSFLDPLATPRTPVVVQLTHGDVVYRFDGFSTEASWEVDVTGVSKLTVKAIDRSVELDAEEKIVAWPGTSDSGVAEAIFGTYGLSAEVESTPSGPDPDVHVVLQRATDWAFVRALADKWGYAAYLEADGEDVVGHFHPVDPLADPQGEVALGFGGDADKVSVRADLLAGQAVSATRVPPLSDTGRDGTSAGDEEPQGANPLGGQVATLLAPTDVWGEVEPDQAALSVARRTAYSATLTCELPVEQIGLLVRARRPLLVRGLGTTLSGRWLVDRVRHTVTLSAHTQHVTLVRNALGVTGDEPFGAAGGLLGGLL